MMAPVFDPDKEREVALVLSANSGQNIDHGLLNKALGQNYHLPASEYLFSSLRNELIPYLPSDRYYSYIFDLFEFIVALTFIDLNRETRWSWCPLGRFAYDGNLGTLLKDVESQGEAWPPLRAGFFGGSPERLAAAQSAVIELKGKYGIY